MSNNKSVFYYIYIYKYRERERERERERDGEMPQRHLPSLKARECLAKETNTI
jgi:hypothetical protein